MSLINILWKIAHYRFFSLGVFGTTGGKDAIWSALLPILPFLCGIAFGTQKDIARCWMFWKWRTTEVASTARLGNFKDQVGAHGVDAV
ncbi:hypothetical protein C8R44DRAFT_979666 [Mycena epipterygia]|nr:hypothetical protein C8R44DRAFT_979666 [Mycena epipterygia]